MFFLCFKVCGGHGNASANSSCPDSPCGGAGCRDSDGVLKCGGKGCKGTVGTSLKALDNADNVHKNLTDTSEELQTIAKKVNGCLFVCAVHVCFWKSLNNVCLTLSSETLMHSPRLWRLKRRTLLIKPRARKNSLRTPTRCLKTSFRRLEIFWMVSGCDCVFSIVFVLCEMQRRQRDSSAKNLNLLTLKACSHLEW